MSLGLQIVWFKRDLRTADHAPLTAAASSGHPVLCLWIYEPSWPQSPEFDASHLEFANECLESLDRSLRLLGNRLITRCGHATDVLEHLWRETGFTHLWSHEETGPDWTYTRDRAVAAWCQSRRISWSELPQHGVFRRLRSRDGWADLWESRMRQPLLPTPDSLPVIKGIRSDGRRTPHDFGLPPSPKIRQLGGTANALSSLDSFLSHRGINYRRGMSSPLSASSACSRLSPYLAWGALSLRSVVQQSDAALHHLQSIPNSADPSVKPWRDSLRSFASRLRWHCHFIQKLEDQPSLEFHNLHRGYDDLREAATSSPQGRDRFAAWSEGLTGFPMIDACMRATKATGWINFRMRAMLASFAAYHLWLHWRPSAVFLARHFLDFEPGIHFPQFQMQSGTTGINTLRIYSPAKQAATHDPDGHFIRQWIPELEGVPASWITQPHIMPASLQIRANCRIGHHYPAPIVDHTTARRHALDAFQRLRRHSSVQSEAKRVYLRHGSRKDPVRPEFSSSPASQTPAAPIQTELPL